MPKSCFISTCKSSHDSKTRSEKIPMYGVPQDPMLFQTWQENIPPWERKLSPSDKICRRHFKVDDFLEDDVINIGSDVIVWKRLVPRLKNSAVPTVFAPPQSDSTTNEAGTSSRPKRALLTFEALKSLVHRIPMPSEYWGHHVGPGFVAFTCFSNELYHGGVLYDKGVVFREDARPRITVRGHKVPAAIVGLTNSRLRSANEVARILLIVDAKKTCKGNEILVSGQREFNHKCRSFLTSEETEKCKNCRRSTLNGKEVSLSKSKGLIKELRKNLKAAKKLIGRTGEKVNVVDGGHAAPSTSNFVEVSPSSFSYPDPTPWKMEPFEAPNSRSPLPWAVIQLTVPKLEEPPMVIDTEYSHPCPTPWKMEAADMQSPLPWEVGPLTIPGIEEPPIVINTNHSHPDPTPWKTPVEAPDSQSPLPWEVGPPTIPEIEEPPMMINTNHSHPSSSQENEDKTACVLPVGSESGAAHSTPMEMD